MAAIIPALLLVVMIAALIDIITRNEWQVRHLPKIAWVLLVIFLPLIGSILWFAIGREYGGESAIDGLGRMSRSRPASASSPEYLSATRDARSTEDQLAELDREIEYYQKLAELEQLKKRSDGEQTA